MISLFESWGTEAFINEMIKRCLLEAALISCWNDDESAANVPSWRKSVLLLCLPSERTRRCNKELGGGPRWREMVFEMARSALSGETHSDFKLCVHCRKIRSAGEKPSHVAHQEVNDYVWKKKTHLSGDKFQITLENLKCDFTNRCAGSKFLYIVGPVLFKSCCLGWNWLSGTRQVIMLAAWSIWLIDSPAIFIHWTMWLISLPLLPTHPHTYTHTHTHTHENKPTCATPHVSSSEGSGSHMHSLSVFSNTNTKTVFTDVFTLHFSHLRTTVIHLTPSDLAHATTFTSENTL